MPGSVKSTVLRGKFYRSRLFTHGSGWFAGTANMDGLGFEKTNPESVGVSWILRNKPKPIF
jgi:hypothetical protein